MPESELLNLIRKLEGRNNYERLSVLTNYLKAHYVPFRILKYATGTNIQVELGGKKQIAISSHFDVVPNSPGANDNASGVAVAIGLIQKVKNNPPENIGLRFLFFDQEEQGLKGSRAYIRENSIEDLIGLVNLEMLGTGDQLALWPLNHLSGGHLLESLEAAAARLQIVSQRFENIANRTADHIPFREAGMENAFTVTCICEKDKEVAYHYSRALEFDVEKATLREIMSEAPLFEHYHKPTDLSKFLSEESLSRAAAVLFNTIQMVDAALKQKRL